jgi:hypothetical protein
MKLLWLVLLTFATLGCSQSTPVTVQNLSSATLEHVVVTGSGFEASMGSIAAGATATAQVRPSGETGLKVSFLSGTHDIVIPTQGYFEGGGSYAVVATVKPDLSVVINASLRY